MKNDSLTIIDKLNEAKNRIGNYPEKILGRGHNQPFNPSTSGARKLLSSSQDEQTVPIAEPELAIVSTGMENRYGDLSSSIIEAEGDYKILRIIDKYSFKPRYHYWVIMYDETNKIYRVQEVVKHRHIAEKHGYHYNTDFMDSKNIGDTIPKGTRIRQSSSYDELGNRIDGANLRVCYISTEKNTEDSVLVNKRARWKLGTTHFKKTRFAINANDRLLNLYSNEEEEVKSFPDVGEEIQHGVFCALRKANKEEELYTLSYNRLKHRFMSDDATIISGKVVDIDVMCNDPSNLDNYYNVQLKKYYDESIRVYTEIVMACEDILLDDPKAEFHDDLDTLYYNADQILKGAHFINDGKEFNNVCIEIMVEEKVPLNKGDKVADRYGGKGVVSYIMPDDMVIKDMYGNEVEVIINQSTCTNRKNPGQLFEISLTHISERIVMKMKEVPPEVAIQYVLDFYYIVSPMQYEYLKKYIDTISTKDRSYLEGFVQSIIDDKFIFLSLRPIQDNMTEDKLDELYKKFPWIDEEYVQVPIRDSNGNIRTVQSRRKCISSMKYMKRLKQYSEDKFSATSLSATNIKSLNSKSKRYKKYKSAHSNTPIAMGTMESDDLSAIGQELVVANLMMNSTSPNGRKLMKQALTGDPFELNIQLDDSCTNRNVEILNCYQKAKGVALVFKKIRKKYQQLVEKIPVRRYLKQLVSRCDDNPEDIIATANKIREQNQNDDQMVRSMLVREMTEKEYEELKSSIK